MTTSTTLEGKIIIITGGTQGVGEGIATLVAERGAAGIIICGRSAENGERVVANLAEIGSEALFVQADLGEVDQSRAIIAATVEHFGRIDGLVNAAATSARGTIEDSSVALFDFMFDVNVRAPFFMIQEAVKVMQTVGTGGSIINISSISSRGGQPSLAAYSASKGALNTLTKNVAHSQRSHRIRANAIILGWTSTPNEHKVQLDAGQPENWLEAADAAANFGRIIRPRDVAGICCYLLSDESEMMTGSIIDFDQNVDGTFD